VKFSTTRLSRLLVQCAVEHLTAFRVSQSRDFSSVRHIVTNDFEAMYAYKCHLYEECFRICEENVDWLLHVDGGTITSVFRVKESDLLHLVDDECVSLISLAKLCGIFDIDPTETESVTQLTLSMYLLIQSKLQLMHSTATIIEALRKVMIVHRRHDPVMTVNRAMMTFVYRKAVRHLRLTTVQRVAAQRRRNHGGEGGACPRSVEATGAAVRFRPRNILSIPRLVDQLSALSLVKTRP
jgi:hypothetical protein